MKSTVKAFGLGVALTATTLGAVTYVNASGNATIRACANKTTGAMRHITKGKCKKTERTLTWNQQGLQGLQGLSGQNLRAIDAKGTDVGLVTSWDGSEVSIYTDGGLWRWDIVSNSSRDLIRTFFDATCSTPTVILGTGNDTAPSIPLSHRYVLAKNTNYRATAAYKPTGNTVRYNSLPAVYEWSNYHQTCRLSTEDEEIGDDVVALTLEQIPLLDYVAPLSVVSR